MNGETACDLSGVAGRVGFPFGPKSIARLQNSRTPTHREWQNALEMEPWSHREWQNAAFFWLSNYQVFTEVG